MSEIVIEWTSNAFDESAFSFAHDLNKDYHYDAKEDDHQVLKRKEKRWIVERYLLLHTN